MQLLQNQHAKNYINANEQQPPAIHKVVRAEKLSTNSIVTQQQTENKREQPFGVLRTSFYHNQTF